MGRILKELVKKLGFGMVMSALTIDGYRRMVRSDNYAEKLNAIEEQAAQARADATQEDQEDYQKGIAEATERTKNCAVFGRNKEASADFQQAANAYEKDPTETRKNALDRAKNKLDESYEEVKTLKNSSFDFLNDLYQNYNEYLSNLTPDKIVAIFNIIIGGLTLSSFLSVLSILLSENMINRIKFLDKYPRILNLLKLRILINKKIIKIYLFIHFVLIV
jgi:hypothetical protein